MSNAATHIESDYEPIRRDPDFKTKLGYINYYPQMKEDLELSVLATCWLVRHAGFKFKTSAATPRYVASYLNVSKSTADNILAELERKKFLLRCGKRGKAIRRRVNSDNVFKHMTFDDYYYSLKTNPNVIGFQLFQEVWKEMNKSAAEYIFAERVRKRAFEGICMDSKASLSSDVSIHERSSYNYLNTLEFHKDHKGKTRALLSRNRDKDGYSKRDGAVQPTAHYNNLVKRVKGAKFNTMVKEFLADTFTTMKYSPSQIKAIKIDKVVDELFISFAKMMHDQFDWSEEISFDRFQKLLRYLVNFAHGKRKPVDYFLFDEAFRELSNYLYRNPEAADHPPDQLIAEALSSFKT